MGISKDDMNEFDNLLNEMLNGSSKVSESDLDDALLCYAESYMKVKEAYLKAGFSDQEAFELTKLFVEHIEEV